MVLELCTKIMTLFKLKWVVLVVAEIIIGRVNQRALTAEVGLVHAARPRHALRDQSALPDRRETQLVLSDRRGLLDLGYSLAWVLLALLDLVLEINLEHA